MNKEKVYQNLIFIGGLFELYLGFFEGYPYPIQIIFCWFAGQSIAVTWQWKTWWEIHNWNKKIDGAIKSVKVGHEEK